MRVCSENGCQHKYIARGFCRAHYEKFMRRNMAPEEKEQKKRQVREIRRKRWEAMTEEEKERTRARKRITNRKCRARKTPEEKGARRRQNREYMRRWWKNLSEEDREVIQAARRADRQANKEKYLKREAEARARRTPEVIERNRRYHFGTNILHGTGFTYRTCSVETRSRIDALYELNMVLSSGSRS